MRTLFCILLLACLPAGQVSCLLPVGAQTTYDPLTIGIGARALSMGRAYTTMTDQGDIIFNNPAGLGELTHFHFNSMSGKVLEDVNYTQLGLVYPLSNKSALGMGYVAAGVYDIVRRDSTGSFLGRSDYSDLVFFAAYGKRVSKKISLGLSLKLLRHGGSNYASSTNSSLNLDVGFLQQGIGPLSFAAVGQNLLTSSSQDPESTIKLGGKLFLLGEKFQAAILSPLKLILTLESHLPLEKNQSQSLHWGLQASPQHNISIQAGYDNNIATYGLSLKVIGMIIDYAYYNKANFFSLGFSETGWPTDSFPGFFWAKS